MGFDEVEFRPVRLGSFQLLRKKIYYDNRVLPIVFVKGELPAIDGGVARHAYISTIDPVKNDYQWHAPKKDRSVRVMAAIESFPEFSSRF